jgi:hypothetical protein
MTAMKDGFEGFDDVKEERRALGAGVASDREAELALRAKVDAQLAAEKKKERLKRSKDLEADGE